MQSDDDANSPLIGRASGEMPRRRAPAENAALGHRAGDTVQPTSRGMSNANAQMRTGCLGHPARKAIGNTRGVGCGPTSGVETLDTHDRRSPSAPVPRTSCRDVGEKESSGLGGGRWWRRRLARSRHAVLCSCRSASGPARRDLVAIATGLFATVDARHAPLHNPRQRRTHSSARLARSPSA